MSASLCVAARFSALSELLAALEPDSDRAGRKMDAHALLRAQVAIEELFANSIEHGYGRECDEPVWLSATRADDVLCVVYADAAAAFDPFSTLKPLSEIPSIPLEEHRVGGLGRLLVKELAQHCEYRRENGRNVVLLNFSLSRAAT